MVGVLRNRVALYVLAILMAFTGAFAFPSPASAHMVCYNSSHYHDSGKYHWWVYKREQVGQTQVRKYWAKTNTDSGRTRKMGSIICG